MFSLLEAVSGAPSGVLPDSRDLTSAWATYVVHSAAMQRRIRALVLAALLLSNIGGGLDICEMSEDSHLLQ